MKIFCFLFYNFLFSLFFFLIQIILFIGCVFIVILCSYSTIINNRPRIKMYIYCLSPLIQTNTYKNLHESMNSFIIIVINI